MLAAMILPASGQALVWTNVIAPGDTDFYDVAASETAVIAVGGNGTVMRSIDGVHWVRVEANMPSRIRFIKYADETFLLGGNNGLRYSRDDGQTWLETGGANIPPYADFNIAAHINDQWLAYSLGLMLHIYTSSDLESWQSIEPIGFRGYREIIIGDGTILGQSIYSVPTVPIATYAFTSPDGIDWTSVSDHSITDIHWDGGQFITTGPLTTGGGQIPEVHTSPDGLTWSAMSFPQLAPSWFSTIMDDDQGTYLAALTRLDGTTDLLFSDDLENWTVDHTLPGYISEILHWRGHWIAVGDGIHVGTRGDPFAVPLFSRAGITVLALLVLIPGLFITGRWISRS